MEKIYIASFDFDTMDYAVVFKDIENLTKLINLSDESYERFLLAVNEVISNAIRYRKNENSSIMLDFYINFEKRELTLTVYANTHHYLAISLREKLDLLKKEKSWAKVLKNEISGRGYWIILEGVTYVAVLENMQKISLTKKFDDNNFDSRPINLLKKFHITHI